ncbi:LysM peptidoglycan-binding domain-containing protein [Isoptericola sp. NPDC057653]|uniref:LysM peptidoglycan-binding domain-containing protein n=1 Tax=Isoptericola sp. NPDC057653 TaxID=3346195 RepID=UPI0036C66780
MSGSSGTPRHPRDDDGLGRLVLLTLVAGVVGTALVLRTASLVPVTSAGATGLTVDRWVELGVLAAGLVAAAWLFLSGSLALACVAAARLGRRWRAGEAAVERLAPAAVRRLVRSAVGVGVGAGLALAPTAALAADLPPVEPAGEASVVLDLGWQPTSEDLAPADAAGGADTAGVPAVPPAAERSETVAATPVARTSAVQDATDDTDGTRVVLRGDTLWDIARDALGGAPSDAEVLGEVTRWHEANRDVVGDDPDRILPGQILRAPA